MSEEMRNQWQKIRGNLRFSLQYYFGIKLEERINNLDSNLYSFKTSYINYDTNPSSILPSSYNPVMKLKLKRELVF